MDDVPHVRNHSLPRDTVSYFSKIINKCEYILSNLCSISLKSSSTNRIVATKSMYILCLNSSCQITLWKSCTILQCPPEEHKVDSSPKLVNV